MSCKQVTCNLVWVQKDLEYQEFVLGKRNHTTGNSLLKRMRNQGAIRRKIINIINQVFHEHPSDLLRILENPESLFSEVFIN